MTKFLSLNQLWNCIGITEFSFLNFLKIIFFITFILVNLSLLYLEYLDRENNNYDNDNVMQKGAGGDFKKICSVLVTGIGVYSALLTIKNEGEKNSNEQNLRNIIDSAYNEVKKISDKSSSEKFIHKLNMDSIRRSFNGLDIIRKEKYELAKSIDDNKAKVKWDTDTQKDTEINQEILRLTERLKELDRQEEIKIKEMGGEITKSENFANHITKEKDESKILDMINAKNSSIFYLDEI